MRDLTPSEHERVTRLFAEATELPPAERRRFLDGILSEQPRIGGEVASLLEYGDDPPAVLRTGNARFETFAGAPSTAPERIGPFRVEGRIAEGGMGVVYRAVQETPVRRLVAVKVLRRSVASPRTLARFELESQALALMSHPSIAGVFDAGLTGDCPWFAMEFVDGEPITDYCDGRRLDLRTRLGLFLRVCDGVEHAHQKAIIHRDLKPSNVLVVCDRGSAMPKIIDFGIAKMMRPVAEDCGPRTTCGEILGTPDYMSPEQAEMRSDRVDTRTDVHALGLLLYELLCGSRPFADRIDEWAGFLEACRVIREVVPEPPSVRAGAAGQAAARCRGTTPALLRRALRGDLDAIVMQALEKSPDRRYASVAALAHDVRRHLGGEPVVARHAGPLQRFGSALRRHRGPAALACAALAVLVAFTAFVVLQNRRLIEQSAIAARQARATGLTRDFAFMIFRIADEDMEMQERLGQVDASLDALAGLFRENPPEHAVFARGLHDAWMETISDDANVLITHALLGTLQDPPNELPAMIELRIEVISTLVTDASVEAAGQLAAPIVEQAERVFGTHSTQGFDARLALGRVRHRQGRFDEAERLISAAAAGFAQLLGPDDRRTLLAATLQGGVLSKLGRNDASIEVLEATLERMERCMGAREPEYLIARLLVAYPLALRGDLDAAIANLRYATDHGLHYAALRDGNIVSGPEAIWSEEAFQPLRRIEAFRAAYGPEGYMRVLYEAVDQAWNRNWDAAVVLLESAVAAGLPAELAYRHDVFTTVHDVTERPEFLASARRHGVIDLGVPTD